MRHGHACVGRHGQGRAHARHDLEVDARVTKRFGFLRDATKERRAPALEAHHASARAGPLDHQAMNLLLRHLGAVPDLADRNPFRSGPHEGQDLGATR